MGEQEHFPRPSIVSSRPSISYPGKATQGGESLPTENNPIAFAGTLVFLFLLRELEAGFLCSFEEGEEDFSLSRIY